ncbi:4-hydroxythreonine-4-phosphate dehydrogenase PdxA [Aporhodopirellula aestuarii]|uniref:4-hydroxythreonine-4-phosphate dehydrogenase PdxA n=1 Tax=Aporhodopirellula aestuarii TaxID=2950107 RepID=A0ABT0U224_9BACT|nr:4-hydroxythreonine-4-phosphate dehydrogenase PdxA [Aporhodopirellula aestuarii]MCM2370905.1 4-hydroxythreonine-4-phosphate dehydrogenase PdxA [Aporhodopirellula aestuarii]
MSETRPKLAITMGDGGGIGPELALRVWQRDVVLQSGIPLLLGDAKLFARVAKSMNLALPETISLDQVVNLPADSSGCIIDCGQLNADAVTPGTYSAETGRASYETMCVAIDAAVAGIVDAVVTGPIQKEAWMQAGIEFPGHTELLAHRVGMSIDGQPVDVRMMLASDTIACVLETIHVPLADVPGLLDADSLARTIAMAGRAMQRRNRRRGSLLPPRIGVCGLNPHAGEHGMFSHGEEERIVTPAIETARREGWDVHGPLPPDTAFTPAMRERVDVYVCLYHDQGLIPLKALSFDDAVNVTLGLPIVRTSVDHGTAMDLAWKGTASPHSMIAAIRLASELVESVA